jgi:diguanylate cyclase (GGDEF)-like protein/PAS domain S-box-containing protein
LKTVRVLLVEDGAIDAQVTAHMLSAGRSVRFEMMLASTLAEALDCLAHERFDVIVLDLGLPDASGLDGVHALRPVAPDATAIVVLSALADEAVALSALEAGAEDYLTKENVHSDGLQRSLRFAIARRLGELARRRLTAIDASDDAVVDHGADGLITTWNTGAERLFGYAADDVMGQPVAMLTPRECQSFEGEMLGRVLGGEHVEQFETRRVHHDGSIVHVSLGVTLVVDGQGSAVGVSTVARDITERVRTAEALRAAEESFRQAFDESPIGMALISLDARFLRVNDALVEIIGHPRDELEGCKLDAIADPEDHAWDLDAMHELLEGRRSSYECERRYVHAAGHPIWIDLSATCIRDAYGKPLHFLGQIQDVTDRHRFEQRLQHMADHDPLTGLLNRRAFERELASQVARNERYGVEGAVLIVDIDHFKYCNDTLGHRAGDELLVRVAHVLSERVRASDVLARLGGDEFAVLLPREGVEAAQEVAAIIMEAIRAEDGVSVHGNSYALTASIGVAMFDQERAVAAESVLVNADLAMYDAKQAGRDCVAFYRPGKVANVRAHGRVKWVEEIRGAMEEGRFTLLAQPIVDLGGTQADRFELLLRMRDRQGELIPPGTFLYIAERLDLIQEIDRWVVGQATDLLSAHPGLNLEVNLSGKSIGAAHLLEQTERDLRTKKVDPARLTFEITETTAVANIALAREFASRLSELGCQFALDDFGSGFGSFYYLKHLPFDYLKIDGEFVRNCASNQTDRLLITSVVNIARGLGKQTIAEFVRDDATLVALRELGVDWGQGYHLGRPAPLDEQLGTREIVA